MHPFFDRFGFEQQFHEVGDTYDAGKDVLR